jgi:REP element-mobilizing transposase RayT
MSQFRKTTPDDTYFITLTVIGWTNLFDREDYKSIIIRNLIYCQQKEGLEIFAYVIMSNHMHLVCRRIGKDLNELIGRFKSFTAKEFINEIECNPKESRKYWLLNVFKHYASLSKQFRNYRIWNYDNHPVLISNTAMLNQKVNYVHDNPLRAGIVIEGTFYKYSSACSDSPLKVLGT